MNVGEKMVNSLKWSTTTEILLKLISPITNMILARILSPNEFGVIATVTMVFSFADMLTDAGFQKYLIQHDFENEEELNNSTNVAFWSNLIVSLIIWGIIILFNQPIAKMLGDKSLGKVIIIACISLPLTSFSSIQLARFKREFEFKSLFKTRTIVALIPLIVTIPLALIGASYWSIIIGNIVGNLFNAIILTSISKWKPSLYFNTELLKKMISYCLWTLADSIAVWFTTWIDIFIIGIYLDNHHLGLYKNSMNMVNALLTIITASLTPVLFVSLSKYQKNITKMSNLFLTSQKYLSALIIPLGIGIYLYRDLATEIMLGSQWSEASDIIGIWSIVSVLRICLTSINSELYRASGKPKIPVYLQLIDLLILIPVCLISIKKGFWFFVYCRSLMRLDLIIPNWLVLHKKYKIKFTTIIKNMLPIITSTLIMLIVAIILKEISTNIAWQIFSIVICIIVYLSTLIINPLNKNEIKMFKEKLTSKRTEFKQ